MSKTSEPDESEYLSREGMRWWLEKETRNLKKELLFRRKEATEFVTAYERGDLTAKEADERFGQYNDRWYPALHGLNAADYPNDEQLYATVRKRGEDEHRRLLENTARELELRRRLERFDRLFGNPDEPGTRSR